MTLPSAQKLPLPTAEDLQGRGIHPRITLLMIALHAGAAAAIPFASGINLVVFIALFFLSINIGIGVGYHRLLTHRGFRTSWLIEHGLAVCGCLALQGGPIPWVATHRLHHQHSDDEFDPHSPHHGTWWSHIGWIFSGPAIYYETGVLDRYAPDLIADPVHVWLSEHYYDPVLISGALQLAAGALLAGPAHRVAGAIGMLLWGTFARIVIGLHVTWLVNSAAHSAGTRSFDTKDSSRNNWWVALLTGGEGWHNNHHAHPVSARHGMRWYQLDPNFYLIWLLAKLGLASEVYVTTISKESKR